MEVLKKAAAGELDESFSPDSSLHHTSTSSLDHSYPPPSSHAKCITSQLSTYSEDADAEQEDSDEEGGAINNDSDDSFTNC